MHEGQRNRISFKTDSGNYLLLYKNNENNNSFKAWKWSSISSKADIFEISCSGKPKLDNELNSKTNKFRKKDQNIP